MFKRAIEIFIDNNKCNKAYINGIINQWRYKGISTLKDLNNYKLIDKNRIGINSGKYQNEYKQNQYARRSKKRIMKFIESNL